MALRYPCGDRVPPIEGPLRSRPKRSRPWPTPRIVVPRRERPLRCGRTRWVVILGDESGRLTVVEPQSGQPGYLHQACHGGRFGRGVVQQLLHAGRGVIDGCSRQSREQRLVHRPPFGVDRASGQLHRPVPMLPIPVPVPYFALRVLDVTLMVTCMTAML